MLGNPRGSAAWAGWKMVSTLMGDVRGGRSALRLSAKIRLSHGRDVGPARVLPQRVYVHSHSKMFWTRHLGCSCAIWNCEHQSLLHAIKDILCSVYARIGCRHRSQSQVCSKAHVPGLCLCRAVARNSIDSSSYGRPILSAPVLLSNRVTMVGRHDNNGWGYRMRRQKKQWSGVVKRRTKIKTKHEPRAETAHA